MILIAESGSTKTDWVVLNSEQSTFQTSGLNPYFVTSDEVASETMPFLSNLDQISEIHFYGTGITDALKGDIITQGLIKSLGYQPTIFTYSDIVAAARALFGDKSGISCILGTGSNSCYWDGSKIESQVPPLGFWLGDEGSGGHLGKSLLLSYLHNEMPKEIREKFENKYGQKNRLEILNFAYNKPKPNKYFAQFSEFINENIKNQFCKELAYGSFEQFFKKYLLKYPNIQNQSIGAVGSIAYYYQKTLKEVSDSYDLTISKIIKKPITELINYHLEK